MKFITFSCLFFFNVHAFSQLRKIPYPEGSVVNDYISFMSGTYNRLSIQKNRIDTIEIEDFWETANTVNKFAFDSLGKLLYHHSKHNSQEGKIYKTETFYKYNEEGNIIFINSFQLLNGNKIPYYTEAFSYDNNRLLSLVQTINYPEKDTHLLRYTYKNGKILNEISSSKKYNYNLMTTYSYNNEGLIILLESLSLSKKDSSYKISGRTELTYNSKGLKIAEKNTMVDYSQENIIYNYDYLGKLLSIKYKDSFEEQEEHFTYNEAGLLISIYHSSSKNWSYENYKYKIRK